MCNHPHLLMEISGTNPREYWYRCQYCKTTFNAKSLQIVMAEMTDERIAEIEARYEVEQDTLDLIAALRAARGRIAELEMTLRHFLADHLSRPKDTGLEWCKYCQSCFISGRGNEINHSSDCIIPAIRKTLAATEPKETE
jgi:hypothetical protein